ncbi:prolipoprotein diacylglyceryl transferase [Mycolicibacillus koreensis]|uniref:Phosphatidylglycerol--prolipoprotein diacylglyceryl transferase n=1 Tax=Mycolicibacillus koreensis TaxID=1069220 RepID=A0AA91PHX6_9MYCO|nr:prolipoprotein diacylglyceryl transferase [Mycolicibacillus koreensis]OSC36053.1 prolipoprotein diacylglyceryl transferase [Mycolicibacillus koreensis]
MTDLMTFLPSPSRGVWYLGPIPIRAYALCIVAGILVALWLGDRRWVARGGQRGVIYDIALWAVPFGLVGGRLYHLMTDWRSYLEPGGPGWAGMWRIWDGGLGIWGAVALGGVGAWIACRRRGIPLPAFGDAIAPGIILAQAIGRIGNYFNQELYGRETDVPWGLEIFNRGPHGCVGVQPFDGVSTGEVCAVVHPTFLYELLWNLAVFVMLIVVDRRFRIGHGRLFALYVAGYCLGRFWVELLRSDHASMPIADIRVNSFTSALVFIGAVVYIVLATRGREDPASLGGTDVEAGTDGTAAVAATAATGAAGATVATTDTSAEEKAPLPDSVTTDAESDSGDEAIGADETSPQDGEETDSDSESADTANETVTEDESDEAEADVAEDETSDTAGDTADETSDEADVAIEAEPDDTDEETSPQDGEEPADVEPSDEADSNDEPESDDTVTDDEADEAPELDDTDDETAPQDDEETTDTVSDTDDEASVEADATDEPESDGAVTDDTANDETTDTADEDEVDEPSQDGEETTDEVETDGAENEDSDAETGDATSPDATDEDADDTTDEDTDEETPNASE